MKFGIADYFVFISAIGIPFLIGVFFAVWERKRNSPVDYFLAGRKFKTWPVALSFVVTFQSSILILGFPAEGYAYGIGIGYNVLGSTAAYVFTALFIVPVFHPLKLTSVNEYFLLRYGNNSVRCVTLAAGIIFSLFYMATVMVGTGYALHLVLGIPFWGTILIYSIVTTIYTSVGGIKAVIWTDVFQFVLMMAGMIAVLVKSSIDAGGSGKVFEYAKDRFESTDFRLDPTIRYQIWNTTFGTFSTYLYLTLMQPAMQRVYSTPTVETARKLYLMSTPIYALFMLIATFEGVVVFAYYVANRCDILQAGLVDNINKIIPFAVLDLFQRLPGLPGLFTASLSSASLSTMSSCLSSLSAVTYEDIIKVKFPNMHAYKATQLSKVIVIGYGIIALILAFAVSYIPGTIVSIFTGFMGSFDGPVVAIFLLSTMYRRSTSKGVIIGAICGCALTFWLNIGSSFSDVPRYPYLPPGPTDQCYLYSVTGFPNFTETSYYVADNRTLHSDMELLKTTPIATSITAHTNDSVRNMSPLKKIYSISYVMISCIGMISSLIIGFLVSLCTSPPQIIDERCMFSFKKHILEELCGHKTVTDSTDSTTHGETEQEEHTKFMTRNVDFDNKQQ